MSDRFVSDLQYRENVEKQCAMSPATLAQLRQHGVTEDTELRLEFFFYTNAIPKMESLVNDLMGIGYEVECGESAAADGTYIVTGWTSKMRMSDDVVKAWTEKMCQIGFNHDTEFDGWGTIPEQ